MQIKRFEAKDMTEALRLVKKEFGANAVILSAKTRRTTSRFLGTSKQAGVVITAATDQYAAFQASERREALEKAVAAGGGFKPLYGYHGGPTQRVVEDNAVEERTSMEPRREPSARVHSVPRIGVKKALNLFKGRLLSQGVESAVAKELINEMEVGLPDSGIPNAWEMKALFESLLTSKALIADPLERNIVKHRGTRVMAIVGPTGMGKTTTVVKLAIKHQLEMKHRVGIISLDHYRIGATAALKTYTQVAGIPFEQVSDTASLKKALDALRDRHIIFVDTPGMGLQDLAALDELADLLEAASPDEVHLALSTTVKDGDMATYQRHFEPLCVSRLLFTKTDESNTHGNILNLLIKSKLPVAYLTGGQKVPEEIEVASVAGLSDLMLPHVEEIMDSGMAFGFAHDGLDDHRSVAPRRHSRYVANRNSDIFHHHQCNSVKRIHQDNIVYFESMEEAMEKKFKPCRMCCTTNRDARRVSAPMTRAAYGRY